MAQAKIAPLPTRPAIPRGFRELVPGETTLSSDRIWCGGQGPFSSLAKERVQAGYPYRPQQSPQSIGHFMHIRKLAA